MVIGGDRALVIDDEAGALLGALIGLDLDADDAFADLVLVELRRGSRPPDQGGGEARNGHQKSQASRNPPHAIASADHERTRVPKLGARNKMSRGVARLASGS